MSLSRVTRLSVLLAMMLVSPARAEWKPNGTQVSSTLTIPFVPSGPGPFVAADASGRLFFADDTVRVFESGGVRLPSGPAHGLRPLGIVPDGLGGVGVFANALFSPERILSYGTDANGGSTYGPALVTTDAVMPGYLPDHVDAATDREHGSFVVWRGPGGVLFIRHVLESGVEIPTGGGIGFGVAQSVAERVALAPADDHGVFVVWERLENGGGHTLWVERFDSLMARPWLLGGGHEIVGFAHDNVVPRVVADGAGGFFLAWAQGGNVDSLLSIRLLRFGPDGLPVSDWPAEGVAIADRVVTYSTELPPRERFDLEMVSDGAGGVFLAWHGGASGEFGVARIDGQGRPPSGIPADGVRIQTDSAYDLRMVSDGAGGVHAAVLTAFTRPRLPNQERAVVVRAFHFGPDLNPASGWSVDGQPVAFSGVALYATGLVPDGSGGAYATWVSPNPADLRSTLHFAQRLRPGGPSAGTAWFVSAEVDTSAPGAPAMRFEFRGTPGATFTLVRGVAGMPVALVHEFTVDANGAATLDDPGLAHATTYRYRIQGTSFSGPVLIESVTRTTPPAPGPAGIRLARPWPNPTQRSFTFAFELRERDGAEASLIDLRGRRVWSRHVGGPDPGRFQVTADPGAMPFGVYWLRLEHDGLAEQQRINVVR